MRRYIAAAESVGLAPGPIELTDEQLGAVLHALQSTVERPHGEGWQQCEAERSEIERLLEQRVRLSKVRRLLHRRGVIVLSAAAPSRSARSSSRSSRSCSAARSSGLRGSGASRGTKGFTGSMIAGRGLDRTAGAACAASVTGP